MNIVRYPIALIKEHDVYHVLIPDIPECYTFGNSISEAIEKAESVVKLHLRTLSDLGNDIPAATEIESIESEEKYENSKWFFISIDRQQYLGKAKRINISLPTSLINRMDKKVEETSSIRDRSKYISWLIINDLEKSSS